MSDIPEIPKPKPKPRRYRRITPDVVARTVSETARQGNATAAVRLLEPDSKAPDVRGHEILAKASVLVGAEYIDKSLQQIAVKAIDRVEAVIGSPDEKTALKAAMFAIDHTRGKAVQRTESRNVSLNIQTVLE